MGGGFEARPVAVWEHLAHLHNQADHQGLEVQAVRIYGCGGTGHARFLLQIGYWFVVNNQRTLKTHYDQHGVHVIPPDFHVANI